MLPPISRGLTIFSGEIEKSEVYLHHDKQKHTKRSLLLLLPHHKVSGML
jgi:hypothetical protein